VLGILAVFIDGKGLVSINRETGVDSQHLRGFRPGLLKLPRLRVGAFVLFLRVMIDLEVGSRKVDVQHFQWRPFWP
jgi:hypothetical protein